MKAFMFAVIVIGFSASAFGAPSFKGVGCLNAKAKMDQVYEELEDWREQNVYTTSAAQASAKTETIQSFGKRYKELYGYFLECGCNSPEFWSQSPEYIAKYRNPKLPKYCRP